LENNIIDKLNSYKHEQYSSGITNAKLAAVALLKLEENDIEKTFENVVIGLQKLFPGKFSLINYPDIPDTIRVDNTLRLDAGKNHSEYLTGNRPKGYRLTATGRMAAEETIQQLESSSTSKRKKKIISGVQRNRYTKLVNAVTQSECFEKFSTKQFSEMNTFDVRRVLHCTLETPEEKAHDNLEALMDMTLKLNSIKEYEKLTTDVLKFLKHIENNWEVLQK
jgi:hypothetical protein